MAHASTRTTCLVLLWVACCFINVQSRHTALSPNATSRFSRRLQQAAKPPSYQIFIDGVLQEAHINQTCVNAQAAAKDPPICGGTLKVNGQIVVVPNNLVVMMPANSLTWQELFQGSSQTGLALADTPPPIAAYSVSVTANMVNGDIRAALIDISQNGAVMGGSGFIDSINYTLGELTIETSAGAAKVRLNDPTGRFGMPQTAPFFDSRFCVDPDNPTVSSATGFPMCIPRPSTTLTRGIPVDPLCPVDNRPPDALMNPSQSFQMTKPPSGTNPGPVYPDARYMAPVMVGDYVTFAGVLAYDSVTQTSFVAAYSLDNNVAIFTWPGTSPAYAKFETALIGTGGLNILGAGEAAVRTRFEGFTTDYSRPVQLWGLDFNPATGLYTKRDYGQVMPDPGPPLGATQGRWRIRPPCTTAGPLSPSSPYLGNKGCTAPPGGIYTPPTREVMVEIIGCTPMNGTANGIASGGCTYRNPTIEYIWPENIPGAPIVPNNFEAMPFLTQGGYTTGGGTLVGTLYPWPSNVVPANACLPPTIAVGGPFTVVSDSSFTVDATVTGGAGPFTYSWGCSSTSPGGGTCSTASTSAASGGGTAVTAICGTVTANATYQLSVTDTCGKTTTALAYVTVQAKPIATILPIVPVGNVQAGNTATLTAILSSTTNPATFTWVAPTPSPTSTPPPIIVNANKCSPLVASSAAAPLNYTTSTAVTQSTIQVQAPSLPLGTISPVQYTFQAVAQVGATGTPSAPAMGVVNVYPKPDNVQITAVAFRCDKHRMSITATTDINNANLGLWLLPYTTNTKDASGSWTTFNPSTIATPSLTYGGLIGGVVTYTITIEPVPLPTYNSPVLTVQSDINGVFHYAIKSSDVKCVSGAPCPIC